MCPLSVSRLVSTSYPRPLALLTSPGLSQSKMIQRWSSQSQTRLLPQFCPHAEQHRVITKGLQPSPTQPLIIGN
ncbi:hypothetical protein GBAR_LOCUS26456 [Geodia barretti]|uniref:Uncharacterized protein n=1 Tax=Geodia barretti TaxID=519541 RepID=A0AA35TGY8_GEOBA|nr:hypothetical protein GBAR_LOCUS26456 [Geodia barretti]